MSRSPNRIASAGESGLLSPAFRVPDPCFFRNTEIGNSRVKNFAATIIGAKLQAVPKCGRRVPPGKCRADAGGFYAKKLL